MIVFIRHAQRGDNELPMKLSQIPYDPPIIQASQTTINKTCIQLVQIFKQNNVSKFKIMSSKYLRCLMTARKMQEILEKQGMQMGGNREYQVEDRIGEYMREDWFKQYPLDNLIYHSEHLHKYLPKPPIFLHTPLSQKLPFPQNYIQFHNRVSQFKKSLAYPQQGTALLIVTHGFVVRELSFSMSQMPRFQNQIRYCGYAVYGKDQGGNGNQRIIKAKL